MSLYVEAKGLYVLENCSDPGVPDFCILFSILCYQQALIQIEYTYADIIFVCNLIRNIKVCVYV